MSTSPAARNGLRVRGEFVEMFGRKFRRPTLHEVCLQIAWATMYASPAPLNESHPHYVEHLAYSEWYRLRICVQLELPATTVWEELSRITGCIVEEQYPSEEAFQEAYAFGESNFLDSDMGAVMWETYEMLKYQITNRL